MATIQGVYVALFGRPADPAGLAYFNGVTKNGADLSAIGNLAGQPEYLERFTNMTNAQIINSIYRSLFDRDAEPAGLSYFSDAMANGTLNINNIAIAILDGAQNADKALISNKLAAAEAFTSRVDAPTEISAYVGIRASGIASKMLAEIKPDLSTIPDNAKIDGVIQEIVGLSAGGTAGGSSAAAPLEEAVPGGATTNTSADSGSSAGGNGQGNTPSASGPEVGSGVTLNGTTMDITGSAVTILKDGTNLSTVTALTANVNNGLKIEQDLPSLTSAVINGQADSSTYAAKFGKIGDTGTKSVKIDASKATGLIDIASIEGSTINIIGSETSDNNVGKFEILPSERLGIFSNAEALNVKIQGGAGQDTYNIYGTVNNKKIIVTGNTMANVSNGPDLVYIIGHEASKFDLTIDVSGLNGTPVLMVGTRNNDVLTGSSADDTVTGLAGNDDIKGGAGKDIIDGDEGNDRIDGGEGNDTLVGGEGGDMIDGGADNDSILGGAGADMLKGGTGDDIIYGDAGDDIIAGGDGTDVLIGGSGDDEIFGSNGDTLSGNGGKDHFKVAVSSTATRDAVTLKIKDFEDGDKLSFLSFGEGKIVIPTNAIRNVAIKGYSDAFDAADTHFKATDKEHFVSYIVGDDTYVFAEGADGTSVGSAVLLERVLWG